MARSNTALTPGVVAGIVVGVLLVGGLVGFALGRGGGGEDTTTDQTSTTVPAAIASPTIVANDSSETPLTTQGQRIQAPSTSAPVTVAQGFPDLFEDLRSAVASVDVAGCDFGSQGTAFLVAPDIAYTAEHVVAGATEIALTFGGESIEATVLGSDVGRDVAALKLAQPVQNATVLAIADADPRVGEEVAAMGHPRGLPLALTVGRVTSMNGSFDFGGGDTVDDLIQTDAVVAPGSSGGPLIDGDGDVVGIVILKDLAAEGLMYAGNIQASRGDLADWTGDGQPVETPICVGDLDLDAIEGFARDSIRSTVDHPDLPALQVTFAAYTQAINSGRAEDGFVLLGPAITTNNTAAAWAEGQATSSLWGWTIREVVDVDGSTLSVRSTFTSTQEAAFGFDGASTCTRWDITHEMVAGELDGDPFWLVNRSRATPGGGPVDCDDWEPTLGQDRVIDPIATGDSFVGEAILDPGTYDGWFTDVDAGATVVVRLDAVDFEFDPMLEVFDASDSLIAENDDRGDGTLDSQVEFETAQTGPLQIRVRDLSDVGGGSYRLTVSIAAG